MNNPTPIRVSLKKDNVSQDKKTMLAGVKAPLQAFNAYAENSGISLTSPSAPAAMKNNLKGLVDALTGSLLGVAKNSSKFGNDARGRVLFAEMEKIVRADVATIGNRIQSEVNLYAENMLAGAYHPFQLAILPHVYLETLAANSRFLMPTKEYVSEQVPPRKMLIRQLVVGNEKFNFPHCLKDPDVMRKLRTAGSEPIELKLTAPFDKTFNIFDKSSKGTKGESSLIPQVDLIKVKYQDAGTSSEEEVEMNVSSLLPDAHNYSMGKLFKTVRANKPSANTEAQIAAEIDFGSGDVKLVTSSEVKEVTFRCYMSGAYNKKSASINMETKPIVQVIKNRINMIFDYDGGAMQNFLSLENIDGVLEGQSIIFDVVIAAKDQYAFDIIGDLKKSLKADVAASINLDPTERGFYARTHYTKPGTTGFHPTSQINWDTEELGRLLKEVHTEIGHKFRSTAGVQYSWFGSPITTAKFINGTPIISKSENYGGMVNEYAVFAQEIGGTVAKFVETERVKDSDGLCCVPFSNQESQPTFEFQQGPHALYTDGTYRNPARPHMPAVAYYDIYDVNYIYAVLGEIDIKDQARP